LLQFIVCRLALQKAETIKEKEAGNAISHDDNQIIALT
jgi:hypothetical protein